MRGANVGTVGINRASKPRMRASTAAIQRFRAAMRSMKSAAVIFAPSMIRDTTRGS